MKYITVKLTEDQWQFVFNITESYTYRGFDSQRVAFAKRLLTTLAKAKIS